MGGILIHDGYTLKATVPAKAGRPAVNFAYRPALAEAVIEYNHAARLGPREEMAATVKILSEQLVSWDVADGGHKQPTAPEVLRKVPHQVLQEMLNFVCGYLPGQAEGDAKN